MPRRLHPTLVDYVVIAINPAIIMVLIASLVYFLLEMFYQGQYPARLHYCLTLFIVGAVLIARISIEEGWERASIFAAAMAVAICLAMQKFVSYKGTNFEQFGWAINLGLVALTWWCAFKLTWDCTLVDDSQDASGQGLLQTAGLDSPDDETPRKGGQAHFAHRASQNEPVPDSSADVDREKGDSPPPRPVDVRLAMPAAAEDSILPADRETAPEKSRWERFIERRRRPHAPGVWVVYFSLAALPMFGLGQAFIPESNETSRRYAFLLLAVYVAAALALLLTTSFLGLRRYLRQRRLEMPPAMAGVWLATGAVLIVALLFLTALLPRPNAEYDISRLPIMATSEEHDTSKLAAGKEGVEDKNAESAPGRRSRPNDEKPDDANNRKGTGGSGPNLKPRDDSSSGTASGAQKPGQAKSGEGKSGKAESAKGQSGKSDSGRSDSGKSDAGKSESSGSKSRDSKSGDQKSGDQKSGDSNSSDSKRDNAKPGEAPQSPKPSEKPAEKKPEEEKSGGGPSEKQPGKPGPGGSRGEKPWRPPEAPPPPNMVAAWSSYFGIIKWAFYGTIAAVVVALLIFHWRTVVEWLLSLVNEWRSFWANFFSRGKRDRGRQMATEPRQLRSFAEFSDPFAQGVAATWPPVELVQYSFEALEAWGRDNGWPREPDETAHDFASKIAMNIEPLAGPARTLAELYSWAAYSPRTLPRASADRLRDYWQTLARVDRQLSAAAETAAHVS
jgi:hypothetical protein